jgi:spore germination protein KB
MNQAPGSVGIIPSFCIIILAVGLMNHVLVIPPLLYVAKRDAWISVIGSIVPYLLWVTLLYYIMRKTKQQPILTWLQQHYGTFISSCFRIFFIIYATFISAMTLRETILWAHISYLPRTPLIALSISLVVVCCFAVHYGFRSIAITAGILLPFVILFGDFVMSANLPAKKYSLLTPIMENGWGPVLHGGIFIGGGLVELVLIVLIQHELKSQVRYWTLLILALFLVILVLGPVTGAIAEFGPFEAAMLRYPAYEEWLLVKIGKYIQHVDFLSIYQWISGALIRISIALYLIIDMLTLKNKTNKVRIVWILILGLILVISGAIPLSDMQYLTFLKQFYFPASLFLVLFLSLVLFLLVLLAQYKGRHTK